MMEPRHWIENGATDLESTLLRAGRDEAPRKGADLRLLEVVRRPPPLAVKAATLGQWTKIGLVAMLGAGATTAAYQLSRAGSTRPSVASQVVHQEPGGTDKAPTDVPSTPSVSLEVRSSPAAREDSRTVRRPAGRTRGRPAVLPAESAPDPSLAEEIAALDQVRQTLAAGATREGLQLLDELDRRFPQGRLRPEAMILRLTALVQSGRRRAADSLGERLLADASYEAYVPRIQSLLQRGRQ